MKFLVRLGFVIHDIRIVEQGGKKVEQQNSYYEGDEVNFDEETAAKHLHKLEPVDKAATAFCEKRFAPVDTTPAAGALNAEAIASIVQAAVSAALAAQAAATAAAPAAPANTKTGG